MLRLLIALSLLAGPALALAHDAENDSTATATPAARSDAGPLPVAAFARLPFVEKATLSPDGTHLAGLFAVGGEQRIVIVPLSDDISKNVTVQVPDQTEIGWLQWVGNDDIILSTYALRPVEGENWYISRLVGLGRKTGKLTKLLWELNGQNGADVLWVPSDGSTEILAAGQNSVYSNTPDFWPTVYRVDVATGKKRVVERGRSSVVDWGADNFGNVRYGINYHDDSTKTALLYRAGGEGGFKAIERARLRDDEGLTTPYFFGPRSDRGHVIREAENGRAALIEVDLATGVDIRTVYSAADANVEGVLLSPDRMRLLGVRTSDRDRPTHWIDEEMASHQAWLDAASPASKVRIISYSFDLKKMLVHFGTADNPGLLFLYDAAARQLTPLAEVNEAIGTKRLSRSKMIRYRARDGLEIEAVLTLPRRREAADLPFIVMPHGGPWAHDELAYDYWVQFLAERGYGVLQPNFRGSTGYGTAFELAGQGQMGFAMQDDISDGVRWAVKEGLADARRVCIVGASYGGYAAMWGIAKDPDQYRCAISIAGVANLRREVNDFGGHMRERLYRSQWQKMTPDFAAVSPINAIDRIKTPLLLVHGKKDVTVDHIQSEKMYAAMRRQGKAVEFVSIPLADHYFSREADRSTLLAAIESFLARHNPPD
jgi:dipeptidyl aminopeptidase/acylaminoacyl peptidase